MSSEVTEDASGLSQVTEHSHAHSHRRRKHRNHRKLKKILLYLLVHAVAISGLVLIWYVLTTE